MNRLLGMGGTTFAYDASGNRTAGPPLRAGFANAAYTWDARNELVAAQLTGGAEAETVQYRYDALGRRIERAHTVGQAPAVTDAFVYDGLDLLAQYRDGAVHQEYVHGPGLDTPWALVDHSGGGAAVYYYHADRLGSIRALTDAAQAVAQAYTYTAFGVAAVGVPGGVEQPFRFTGREYDAPTGLYYYRARYYDAHAGRFISQDPLGFGAGSPNYYLYTLNQPVNLTDPTGEFWVAVAVIVVVIVAVAFVAHSFINASGAADRARQNSRNLRNMDMTSPEAAERLRQAAPGVYRGAAENIGGLGPPTPMPPTSPAPPGGPGPDGTGPSASAGGGSNGASGSGRSACASIVGGWVGGTLTGRSDCACG